MSNTTKTKYIFHITHIRNLAKILESGCLWSDDERRKQNLETKSIAYQAIKDRRAQKLVPTCKRGFLSHYVPFYFAARSPMLYANYRGKIDGNKDGQDKIIHLVSKVETVVENSLPFTFTNGHAEMATTEFYDDLKDLNKVDWTVMKARYWISDEDGDMQRRRQAEFLVHNHFPLELIAGIGVISEQIKDEVEAILGNTGFEMSVKVLPQWYY